MKSSRKELGNWGENLAVDYLKERDYSIVDRNLRTPYGELDIIALQRPIENSNIYSFFLLSGHPLGLFCLTWIGSSLYR